jgi:hypothetical protein
MQTINVNKADATSIESARNAAVSAVRDDINDPVVMSWHDRQENTFAPDIPGGDPETPVGKTMARAWAEPTRYWCRIDTSSWYAMPPALLNRNRH